MAMIGILTSLYVAGGEGQRSMFALRGKLYGSIVPTAKSIFTLHDVMKITDGEPCHNSVLWKEDITR
jgi:hypothetical protein